MGALLCHRHDHNRIALLFFLLVSVGNNLRRVVVVVEAFHSSNAATSTNNKVLRPRVDTVLLAKTKKNNKKAKKNSSTSTTASGGFGKIPVAATVSATKPNDEKEDQDYAVFPALDPQVADTLVTAPASLQQDAGFLPAEIYDRLDQIYGFPNFNYETKVPSSATVENDKEELSFGDLLSTSTTTTATPTTTDQAASSMSDLDFADLISTATGGTVNTPEASSTSSSSTSIDNPNDHDNNKNAKVDLFQLPPFEKLRVLHVDPLVLAVDDFFTDEECDRYVDMSLSPPALSSPADGSDTDVGAHQLENFQTRSKTVGKDAAAKSQRTSTTWFHHYKNVPEFMAKATRLVGLDTLDRWEEPQTVRYRKNEKFTWHLDALAPPQATPDQGGQRLATLLVYLKDLEEGGATIFRDLKGLDGGPLRV